MKILFVTPECAPWVKTGGLGDVSAALPRALRALGHDVAILLPAYGGMSIDGTLRGIIPLPAQGPWPAAQLLQMVAPDGMPLWLLSCPALFTSASTPYGDPAHQPLQEQAQRFGLLSRVAAWLGTPQNPSGWQADIVHANDWPGGLAPLYLQQARVAEPTAAPSTAARRPACRPARAGSRSGRSTGRPSRRAARRSPGRAGSAAPCRPR